MKSFYTIKEFAETLDVHPRTVRRWIWQGDILVFQKERIIRIPRSEIKRWINIWY